MKDSKALEKECKMCQEKRNKKRECGGKVGLCGDVGGARAAR